MEVCSEYSIDGREGLLKIGLAVKTEKGLQLPEFAYSALYGCSRGGYKFAERKSLPQPPSYSDFKHDTLFHLMMLGFRRDSESATGSGLPEIRFISTERINVMVKEASSLVDDEELERYYEQFLRGIKI